MDTATQLFDRTPAQATRVGLFIDSTWIYDRPTAFEVRNPSTEALVATVPKASADDLAAALRSAQTGFRIWRDTPALKRNAVICAAITLVRARAEEIASAITRENGKLISDARGEVERSASFFEWDMAEALRAYGTIVPAEPQMQKLVIRQPIGPVAAFTPWNVPLSSPSRKVSAALTSGCSIILKAAEETPTAACILAQCFHEAGLPPGVLNLVFGDPAEISETLIASPITRLVTLTGSVQIGKALTRLSGEAMKPVLMELGGNAPVLVCADVNGQSVGRMAARAKMRINGQICASPSRFLVHRSVYDAFVDGFSQEAGALKVGDGMTAGSEMGPVSNAKRLSAMQRMVDDATARGGRAAVGGHRVGEKGYFFAPTLLVDIPLDSDAMTVEPFGPVGACVPFETLDEAIEIANGLSVGLSAYAFTNSLEEAERIARELECGVLSINHFGAGDNDTPFGGVKESGIGREGGATSLDSYMITKAVLQKTGRV